jgi:crotonobetainyl-CoA:carnitine CoA-transferase CaiB-like acyl-CoA transferase
MTDGAFAWLCTQMGVHFATGEVPKRGAGTLTGGYPCYNVYECADGEWLTVGALEAKFFRVLCEVVGREDLLVTHMDSAAVPTWREVFRAHDRDDWLARFEGRDACVGPVNDFPAALADAQLLQRGMVVEQEDPSGQSHPQLGTPIKLRNHPASLRSPAPLPGQDTRRYLEEAGLPPAEIEEIVERK